jgi:lysyl-tRNA synthetase class 2
MKSEVLSSIRQYFAVRDVLEVDTPILSRETVTDLNLDALSTFHTNPLSTVRTKLFMQTSPEYFMKRMLCAGFPSMYQIAKCFRDDEVGKHHSPEFTMLEWYRLDFSMEDLVKEVGSLLSLILESPPLEKLFYADAFIKFLDVDVIGLSKKELIELCQSFDLGDYAESVADMDDDSVIIDALLQVLFCERVETQIGVDKPIAITHFPASQASLAQLNTDDTKFSQRFEVYYKGMELANGFEELGDPVQLNRRFTEDNRQRKSINKSTINIDERFIQAHESGLPACSGVALGLDRLLMIKCGAKHIDEVQSFSFDSI